MTSSLVTMQQTRHITNAVFAGLDQLSQAVFSTASLLPQKTAIIILKFEQYNVYEYFQILGHGSVGDLLSYGD
jgi:hypothetical protein